MPKSEAGAKLLFDDHFFPKILVIYDSRPDPSERASALSDNSRHSLTLFTDVSAGAPLRTIL